MRPQKRPFTVEIKRARKRLAQPATTATFSMAGHLSGGEASPGDAPAWHGHRDAAMDRAPGEALQSIARVFGGRDRHVIQARFPNRLETGTHAAEAGSVESGLQKPRVLADLLSIERERDRIDAMKKRRRSAASLTTRRADKTKGDAMWPDDEQITPARETSEWSRVELDPVTEADDATSGAPEAVADPAAAGLIPSSDDAPALPRTHSEAAPRSNRRGSSIAKLPRSERWKERRLPRVCWDRSARSHGRRR